MESGRRDPIRDVGGGRRHRLYVAFAGALLACVLVGFGRTLFLRAVFSPPAVPSWVILHGAILTSWFVLFAVQAGLVKKGRVELHRRLGVASVVVAALVVATSSITMVGLVPRLAAQDFDVHSDLLRLTSVFWGNAVLVLAFMVFFVSALVVRANPEVHRRLMLLASISLIPPAVGRIFRLPVIDVIPEAPGTLASLLVMLIVAAVADRTRNGRLHPVTVWGGVAYLVALIAAGIAFPLTPVAQAVVLSLIDVSP